MDKLLLGIIAGLVYAILDVLIMIPLDLEDKRTAMAGVCYRVGHWRSRAALTRLAEWPHFWLAVELV